MMKKFGVRVFALSSDGTGGIADLGQTEVEAEDRAQARSKAIEELWDPRLTCASCHAETQILWEKAA